MRPIASQIRARRARSASYSIDSRRNGCPTQWTDIKYALRSMNVLGPTRSAMTSAPISSTRSKSTRCRSPQMPTAGQCIFSLSQLSICGPLCLPAWPWFGKVAMYRLRSRQAQRLDDRARNGWRKPRSATTSALFRSASISATAMDRRSSGGAPRLILISGGRHLARQSRLRAESRTSTALRSLRSNTA
jgi:hypothetical protein